MKFGRGASRIILIFSMSCGLMANELKGQTSSGPLPGSALPVTKYSPQQWAQNNPCTHPIAVAPRSQFEIPGLFGRPYREQLPGGCVCGNASGVTRCPDASIYWSAPASAVNQQRNPGLDCWWESTGRQQFFAPIDRLGQFSGAPFRRTDNGYCGPSADPYGCLSASRQR